MKTNLKRTLWTISLAFACALITTLASLNAAAAESTANMGVSSSIADNCTISALPVAFGTYDTIGVNVATGSI